MPESDTARPRADWAKAAEGIQLAGFAVFLLLNTTGVLPWSFWLDAISLWPVLIMSAGIKIAFEKSRAPWLLLLGPALVLGSLAWLASGNRPQAPAGPWERGVPGPARGNDRRRARGVPRGLPPAPAPPPTDLPRVGWSTVARWAARRRRASTCGRRTGVAQVRLDGGKRTGSSFVPRARERWELRLPAELPLDVRIKGAGVGGELDLTAGSKVALRTEGVFIGVAARLPAPREETEIRMNGVFNSLTLSVPEGTPVRVHGPGLPFNAVDRGVRGAEGRPGYDVSVQGDLQRGRRDHRPHDLARASRRSRGPSVSPVAPAPPVSSTPASPPPAEAPPAPPERPEGGGRARAAHRELRPQASCSRNSPKSFTKTFRTTMARTKCAASTYHTYSGCPRSFT